MSTQVNRAIALLFSTVSSYSYLIETYHSIVPWSCLQPLQGVITHHLLFSTVYCFPDSSYNLDCFSRGGGTQSPQPSSRTPDAHSTPTKTDGSYGNYAETFSSFKHSDENMAGQFTIVFRFNILSDAFAFKKVISNWRGGGNSRRNGQVNNHPQQPAIVEWPNLPGAAAGQAVLDTGRQISLELERRGEALTSSSAIPFRRARFADVGCNPEVNPLRRWLFSWPR